MSPPTEPPWARSGIALADNDRGLDWIRDRAVECATPEELDALSAAAWEQQRAHVAQSSDFYRNKLARDIDLARLPFSRLPEVPFTTKRELQRAQGEDPPFGPHLAVDPERVKRVFQTSGSSGTPSMIALTRRDLLIWRTIGSRSYYGTGIRPHNAVLTTFGAGPFVAGHTHAVLDELGCRTVPVGPGDTARVLAAMRAGLVDTLLGTPSFALYLADRLEGEGTNPASFGMVHFIVGGEPGGGLPAVRDRIENAFRATVNEAMGLGDITPSLFGECPAQQGMHFSGQGFVWPELVDDEGTPMPIREGAEGELVYTHLERNAMPLIRFRSGDYVRIVTTGCPCGRTSFTMRIAGRVDDMFIVRGVNVYPSAIQAVVGGFAPDVTGRSRVIVPTDSVRVDPPVPVEVEVPDGSPPPDGLASRIEDAVRSRLKFRAAVQFVAQSEFGSAEYKTRPVVRRD